MPFGVAVGSVEKWIYYTGVEIVEGEGAVLVINVGHPIVTDGDFVA